MRVDCYLCGASNADDADFCHKCDGQLLKIGALEPEEPVEVEGELVVELDQEFEDEAPSRRRAMRSLEHSRLEAALGLGDDLDPEDEPEAPSFSNAGNPGNIPMIGTRTAPVTFETSTSRESGGKFIYVMLALLTAAVAWLGYQTLVIGSEGPENLAFNETAVEFNTTPVTVPEARPWTESEVSSKFARAFVTVRLYDCPSEIKENTEADSERAVQGVAINNHNVIFNASDIRGADAASIRTQLGFSEIALINRSPEGFAIATTHRNLTRNLALAADPEGTDTYFMSYDTDLNLASIDIKPSSSDIEVSITEHGQPTSVRLDNTEVSLESLLALSAVAAEYEESEDAKRANSVCARSQFLTNPDEEPAPADDPIDPEEPTEEAK
jgi:hypothetical protein